MKTKYFFLVFIITAVYSSCSKEKYFSKLNYEGVVVDKNETPVQGVKVILDASGYSADNASYRHGHDYNIGSCTTDVSGHFQIKGKQARSNDYHVSIAGQITMHSGSYTKDGLPSKLYSN